MIETILLSVGIAHYFFNVAKININFKPFNCQPCFIFWCAVGCWFIPSEVRQVFICATFAHFLYILVNKYYNEY